MKKDNYLTVSQAAEYLNCTKEEVKELVDKQKLRAYKALPNDVRYLVSMREVNKLSNQYHKGQK